MENQQKLDKQYEDKKLDKRNGKTKKNDKQYGKTKNLTTDMEKPTKLEK